MTALRELDGRQISEVIQEAVDRHIPVTVTIRRGKAWTNLRSRAIAIQKGHLWIEQPLAEGVVAPREFAPAEKLGLAFKLKHYKYIFTATVAGMERFRLDDGVCVLVLSVCIPSRMQRLQRRAFFREDVPEGCIVRASFWLGGREDEPAGTTPDRPVWCGRVINLSAGGFQVRTTAGPIDVLDVGDIVGVHLAFGTAEESFCADAQFRHSKQDGRETLLGFQFMGLAQTPAGRAALQLINAKLSEYHRLAEPRLAQRH